MVVLEGEAGIGKSRLVDDTIDLCQDDVRMTALIALRYRLKWCMELATQ